MRRFFVVLAVVLAFKCFSYDEYLFFPQGQFIFTSSYYSPYLLSDFYFESGTIYGVEKNQQKIPIGTVEKLNEWTQAYVFKVGDTALSTHRASLWSAGTLFNCLKTYEIYDENSQLIGFIEGIWNTDAAACFLFYKADRELVAKASLFLSPSTLTISTPDDQILMTGCKTLRSSYSHFRWDTSAEYYWEFKKQEELPFDGCFFWPFIAFLSEVWWE